MKIGAILTTCFLAALASPQLAFAQASTAPPNDAPSGAIAVPTEHFVFAQPTQTATHAGEQRPCATIGNTVWYSYQPRVSRWMRASTHGSAFDTAIAVYLHTPLGLLPLACNDDAAGGVTPVTSRVTWYADESSTYYVQAGGYDGRNGALVVRFEPAPPQAQEAAERFL